MTWIITVGEGMLLAITTTRCTNGSSSPDNFIGRTPAALGVAAHEAGHAIQHAQAYGPLHWRMAAVGITTYANYVVMFPAIAGAVYRADSAADWRAHHGRGVG